MKTKGRAAGKVHANTRTPEVRPPCRSSLRRRPGSESERGAVRFRHPVERAARLGHDPAVVLLPQRACAPVGGHPGTRNRRPGALDLAPEPRAAPCLRLASALRSTSWTIAAWAHHRQKGDSPHAKTSAKRTFTMPLLMRSFAALVLYMPVRWIALVKPATSRALRENVMPRGDLGKRLPMVLVASQRHCTQAWRQSR